MVAVADMSGVEVMIGIETGIETGKVTEMGAEGPTVETETGGK